MADPLAIYSRALAWELIINYWLARWRRRRRKRMQLYIYCKQAMFQLTAPDDWNAVHFRNLVNMLRADGYFSWNTPLLYIPTEQIIGMSLQKDDENVDIMKVFSGGNGEKPTGRPN